MEDYLIKKRRSFFSVVMVLFWFSLYAYMPQMTTYAKELGASYKLIGLIAGAYGVTQTILRIPLGIVSDKLMNRKAFIIFGIICAIISATVVYLAPSPYTLLAARLFAGAASATWVNFTVLFIGYFTDSESSRSVGIATSNSKIGQVFAMFIGGYIAVNYGVRNIFLICIIVALLSLIMGFFIYEEKIEVNSNSKASGISKILKNRRILYISFLGCLTQFITYSTTFGFTPIVASDLGADSLQLSYLSTVNILPQIVFSMLSTTFFSCKFGERKTLLVGFILSVIVCVLTPFTPNIKCLYIIQFLSGTGSAITFSILMGMVMEGVEAHLRTTTMGFYQASYGIGMIVGPMILGTIGDLYGLETGFMVIGILGLLSIWSILKIKEV